jgi:alpha-L-fucosidase
MELNHSRPYPMNPLRFRLLTIATLLFATAFISPVSAADAVPGSLNKPERLEWFRDLGFGLFIHWSVDSQLGVVISHSLVGASEQYNQRFFTELPKTFNPRKFHPQDWAALAKLAGIRYVVFTAKHHAGFCMWPTVTTDFDIAHTPFRRDITAEVLEAFRAQDIAPGLYFSPEDFHWLHQNGKPIERRRPHLFPAANPGLLAMDQAQVRELLTNYGSIDILFFDGPPEGLREKAWELNPNVVVTRGAIQTPEKTIPGVPLDGAWEACMTMGNGWQYQPTLENYKSGGQCISMLVEIRAKGGNLLLNVGPKPDGELPIEQEERLREIALWMYVNSECIYGVRPWIITNEKDIWFTKKKDEDTIYAIVKNKERWAFGAIKDLVLKSIRATDRTEISVLGQNDKALEYQLDVVPKTTWKQEKDGLHIKAQRAQRLDDVRQWPNPVVLKLTHVQPALTPPQAATTKVQWSNAERVVLVQGELKKLGDAAAVEVGFEYRDITGMDTSERDDNWVASSFAQKKEPGEFSDKLSGLVSGRTYEFRSVVRHPLLACYGQELKLKVP